MGDELKIVLNTESIRPGMGGIGYYTQQLADGLRKHVNVASLHCFPELATPEQRRKRPTTANRVRSGVRAILRRVPGIYDLRQYYRNQKIGRELCRLTGYVYHEPNYVLMPYDGPSVVSVHDLSHIRFPEHHPKERVAFLQRYLEESVYRAGRIITGSEFSRREIVSMLGVQKEKISIIHHGVDPQYRPRRRSEMAAVLRRYALQDLSYILAVGTIEPRKNLASLFAAYSKLAVSLRQRFPLVVVGAKGWLTGEIERQMAPLERMGLLRWLGYVPQEDLPFIYSAAHTFVFPSLYEGFGLPLVEAMSSGVPVVASIASAMPEVGGAIPLYVDPLDADDLSEKLKRALLDTEWRESVSVLGLERARHFTWSRCVDETISVYRQALE